jgi:hypothetical protein
MASCLGSYDSFLLSLSIYFSVTDLACYELNAVLFRARVPVGHKAKKWILFKLCPIRVHLSDETIPDATTFFMFQHSM